MIRRSFRLFLTNKKQDLKNLFKPVQMGQKLRGKISTYFSELVVGSGEQDMYDTYWIEVCMNMYVMNRFLFIITASTSRYKLP